MNSTAISSWSWRHRLYAFLLRRALGPFLSKQSTADLHRSILDIDWSEGKLVLVDVELDADHLNSIIAENAGGATDGEFKLSVRRACIRRLSINIGFVDCSSSSTSSKTRKATAAILKNVFGASSSKADNNDATVGGMALKVHVDLDGLSFVLSPTSKRNMVRKDEQKHDNCDFNTQGNANSTKPGDEDMAAPGFFSSLVDSAMKSLRLSINVTGLKIRTCSHYCSGLDNTPSVDGRNSNLTVSSGSSGACWIDVRLASARYYDLVYKTKSAVSEDCFEKRTISKALDLEGFTIDSNSIDSLIRSESPQLILQSAGLCSIRFTVIEKWSTQTSTEEKPLCLSTKQKTDVSLCERITADVDPCSLSRMVEILNAVKMPRDSEDFVDAFESDRECEQSLSEDHDLEQQFGDAFYKETYDQIMKQFTDARHLARTRELRGGLLVPEQNDNEDLSFDTFFDANDHSLISYYSNSDGNEKENQEYGGKASVQSVRESEFALTVLEFTIRVNLVDASTRCFRSVIQQDDVMDCILMSMGDINITHCHRGGNVKSNFSVTHLEVESQLAKTKATLNESMFRFLDISGGKTIPNQPCISVAVDSSDEGDECTHRVDVSLHPIEIIYHERAVTALCKMIERLSPIGSQNTTCDCGEVPEEGKKNHMFVTARCSSIVLMIACQDYSVLQNSSNTNLLFQRHGYVCEESGGLFLGIGIELDNVAVDISKKCISIDSDSSYEDKRATLNSSNALLFARSTELKRGRRRRQTFLSRRVDLVAFTRDEDSDSNTFEISFQQRQPQMRRTSAFPFVIPLTSVKAQQESDDSDDEIDNLYEDAKKSAHERMTVERCQMESSDPQYIMSAEANEADMEFKVGIASIFFDLTADERRSLSIICSTFGGNIDEQGSVRSYDTTVKKKSYVGLSINVGQFVSMLHGQDASIASFSLVVDNIQSHALIASNGIRNIRFFFADVVLYQLSHFNPAEKDHMDLNALLLAGDRCQRIRSRLMKSTDTVARAIFFRSKLCRPMSPETPAFLVDALFRNGDSDDEYDEIGIHCVIYDMTYRYEMNSDWVTSLSALVKSNNTEDNAVSAKGAVNETNSMSLFNVVVKVADCNIDYTPPPEFRHGSRIIVRLGGVRLASNIVSPSVSVQAFKISLTDLRLYICSYRFKHNAENILLSCAHRYFSSGDLQIDGHSYVRGGNAVSWEDVLFRMNFVNLIVLDSLDAVILQTDNDNMNNCHNDRREPAVAVALTLGHFSLYACRDSFSCFAQTYNEWFIQTTSLTDDELESLRLLSEAQSDDDIDKGRPKADEKQDEVIDHLNHTTTHLGVTKNLEEQNLYRDEVVSMNLTETLLFENYYTIDATNRGDRSLQSRQMDMIEGNKECDGDSGEDEWATVEHDYTQFCGIPTDEDERAEWIVCNKLEKPDNNSQELKIFPQHVPVHPVSDPLSESKVDSAKLAGTELAPDIGLRIIVKDASITIRLFDGFDYVNDPPPMHTKRTEDRRDQLLCNLMGDEEECSTSLLSRNYNDQLHRDRTRRREHRNVNKYFQVSFEGLKLKQDSYKNSKEHRLASYLDLSISDFYIAEAISNDDPLKLMGEWVNETEHPRDDNDGIIMLKIVTKHPSLRVSADGKLMSDESQATLELLPLRCYLNQKALRFMRNFFAGTPDEQDAGEDNTDECDEIDDDELINIFFNNFKVLPCKLKVDYVPEKMDIESLRDGNYSEILNLCPLEDMIINLAAVENHDLTGWGAVFSELAGKWIEDICSTQAHKFFTRAAPIQLLSTLGDGVADLALVIIVPEDNASAYLRNVVGGTTSFATKVAVEAISTSAKLTRFAANQLTTKALPTSPLPSRPRNVPRNAGDTASHAYRSLLTGLREANHNICVVPFREYQQSGASGAALGAMRGIPLGVVAPIAGASEALSYTLLGIRNQLKPDKRKEEENSFMRKE